MIPEKVTRLSPLFPKSGAKVLLFSDICKYKQQKSAFTSTFSVCQNKRYIWDAVRRNLLKINKPPVKSGKCFSYNPIRYIPTNQK